MCRRESGERIEPRYPATLDPTDVNRFAVRESRVKSDDLLFLAEQGSIRTYMLAGATHLRVYQGKKVRISGTLKSPHVTMVRTIDEINQTANSLVRPELIGADILLERRTSGLPMLVS